MTGAAHAAAVQDAGARLHPLPEVADLDDSTFDSSRHGKASGITALNLGITRLFLAPMPHQAAELSAAMARRSQLTANTMLRSLGVSRLPVFLLDIGVLADQFIVPTVPSFEYPRSDLPPNVRFIGAVHPPRSPRWVLPTWWHELDDDRPVVHVTQGTVDNADLSRLIEPTIEALGGEDVVVVATTCGGEVPAPLPRNVFVAEHIPA